MKERAETLTCEGAPLVSIIHEPDDIGETGLVIIVAGGPQYRVGAHRQFVLLARQMAGKGIPVIRFDHRGTGDSGSSHRGFTDMNADIRCAVDYLSRTYPKLQRIALWGECESASAAAYYAHTDDRISGIFMVNPWVRTDAGLAKTYLKHHYRARLADPEFWRKVRSGKFSISESFVSIVDLIKQVNQSRLAYRSSSGDAKDRELHKLPLTERLEQSLLRFSGDIFVLTSGRDHIAQEYRDFVQGSSQLKSHMQNERVQLREIEEADHTFSRTEWRIELFNATQNWLTSA